VKLYTVSMSSDIQNILEFVGFIAQWFIGWLIDCPYVLVIIVLVGWGTIATWRLLTTMTTPSILTSPKTSLMLLLGLSMVVMRGYNTNQKLLALQNDIDDANWIIRQGGQHRLDLLNQIERQGLGRPKVENQVEEERKANPLDGCLHVLIDLASDQGLSLRQLYEPKTFPLSPAQPLYEKFFGSPEERRAQDICAVTFQPDSSSFSKMTSLAKSYSSCGIKAFVYQAGIGHADVETAEGRVVRLAKFITEVVAVRKLPTSTSGKIPRLVMVMAAGGDNNLKSVITDMLVNGAFGHVDSMIMERQENSADREMLEAIMAMGELTHSEGIEHQFEVVELEDDNFDTNKGENTQILPEVAC